jgi:hypothetical protein
MTMPEHRRDHPPRVHHVIPPIAVLPGQNLHEGLDVGMMAMPSMGLGGCGQADQACEQQGEKQWLPHGIASRLRHSMSFRDDCADRLSNATGA